jgi:protein required for attachment to host cells
MRLSQCGANWGYIRDVTTARSGILSGNAGMGLPRKRSRPMNDCWIIVADGARARFMTLERNTGGPSRAALRLVESAGLSNPEHTVSGRRATRKIKSGRDTGRGSVAPHGYTDHREPHEAELLRRFVAHIAQQAAMLVADEKAASIVLVAEPRMLALLHAALEPVTKAGVTLRELARDYTWCTVPQLQRHLAENGLLPGAERAG